MYVHMCIYIYIYIYINIFINIWRRAVCSRLEKCWWPIKKGIRWHKHTKGTWRHMNDTWPAHDGTWLAHDTHMTRTWQAQDLHINGTLRTHDGTWHAHDMHMTGTWLAHNGTFNIYIYIYIIYIYIYIYILIFWGGRQAMNVCPIEYNKRRAAIVLCPNDGRDSAQYVYFFIIYFHLFLFI